MPTYNGTDIRYLTDPELEEAAECAEVELMKLSNRYGEILSFYQTIGEEMSRRSGAVPDGATIN